MQDWLSFIVFAGLFYFLMRFGCGAHRIHGKSSAKKAKKQVDPVCGMDVEVDRGYGKMHEGTLYRFCSRNCLDKFENQPDKYLKQSENNGGVS